MKIVHVITRLILGGAQENTLITCEGLAARGHDVVLITGPAIGPEGALFEQTKKAKFKTIVVDSMRREINPLIDIPAYKELKSHLKKIAPDIVHTHSAKAGILGRFAANNLKPRPKIIHTVHGLAFHEYQNQFLNRFYIAIEKTAARRTDAFISVADAMTEKMLAAGLGTADKFTTAYSAISDEFFADIYDEQKKAFREKYAIAPDATVLVTIARLFELKGHEYIVDSARTLAKRYPECIWLFVGDGILKSQLRRKIVDAGLEKNFRFTGLLPTSQMPLVIQSSDILVHCSLREGLARVLPQALACGRPAISFDIDGAKEVINNSTGRLTEPENIDQLIAACGELIENKEVQIQLGQAGREFVKNKFAPETMVEIIENVYEGL